MKNRFTSLMTTLILGVLFSISASAYDVEVDGIYYNLNTEENSAEVTFKVENEGSYEGNIDVPSSIVVNGIEYSVLNIGHRAFEASKNLSSINIPNSITSIGNSAFSSCSGLASITIPNSVTSIGNSAFSSCSGLTSITIPNSVTSIGDFTFSDCKGLTSITIPNSVTSIGNYAFFSCIGLTSVIIPNSVTSIGECAFCYCSGLTSIDIPNSVTSIGYDVFEGCNGIINTIIVNDMFVFLPQNYNGHFSVPENISKIIGGAFRGCKGLSSVTIPDKVTSIDYCTFTECSALTSVIIPNSVRNIGIHAFSNCNSLTSIEIPNSVTSIENSAFFGCNSLTSITIPNSVKSIGDGAFSNCMGLISASIPQSVESIGISIFGAENNIEILYCDCSNHFNIIANSLKELVIGDNVNIVYDNFKISPLRKVLLGKNITQIRTEAFYNSNIEEFTITGEEPPYLYPNVFGSQDLSNAKLYVPESKTEYYQTTEPWSKFGKILKLNGETPSEPEKCATPSISFSEGQLRFSCETEGAKCYYTLNNSDVKTGETLTESKIVNLSACYDITCYAKAEGYVNSDVATAKLYWLPSSGTLEGDNINNVAMRGIAIQSAGGFINISGLDNNEKVDFYGVDGKALGSATSIDGSVSFSAEQGAIVVAKIGKESVKIFTN